MMKIRVCYFSVLREWFGRSEEQMELAEPCTAGELLDTTLANKGARHLARHLGCAINRQVVPRNTPLTEGDEVAFLPPLAGG